MQNLSIGVNVVYEGSPSRILKVLLISFGMTILPKSSTLLTIPVAFIYLSPFLQRTFLGPLPEGAGTANAVTEGGKAALQSFYKLRYYYLQRRKDYTVFFCDRCILTNILPACILI